MDVWLFQTLEDVLCVSKLYLVALERILNNSAGYLDEQLSKFQPSHILFGGALILYLLAIVINKSQSLIKKASIKNLLVVARNLPIIRTVVKQRIDKIGREIKKELSAVYQDEGFVYTLPRRSTSPEVLLKKVKHYQMFDTSDWQQGRISGAIYTSNSPRLNEVLLSVYGSNMWSNPLHSDVFAGIRKMESEIIRMVVSMYRGDPNRASGSVTSGGTESIIMACKAYRDYAKKVRGIEGRLEIVAPVTAHAAFEKAANFLDCDIKHIPVDMETFKVDLKAMEQAITSQTCMLVGSAPQFPHGIVDPITEIALLGRKYKIPVHVDACLGGFLIPFMREAYLYLEEDFDFTVGGVTSISADTHKYAYAPKGTSVVIYRDRKFLHQQYSIQTDWPGGIYASPTLPGSRPGALIATCWAAMMFHGREGYIEATTKIIKTTRWIKKELSNVEGLRILGDPQVSVLAFASDVFDIYALNGRLKDLGWNLNALQFPSSFHLCVTLMHTNNGVAASFVKDVKFIAKKLMLEPNSKPSGSAAIYGMSQTIPDRSLVAEICSKYLDGCLGF